MIAHRAPRVPVLCRDRLTCAAKPVDNYEDKLFADTLAAANR